MDTKLSVRDRIFQAALARIKHYGFGKTTMAEIAADCGMSPGNIYRFFEAKIDIAESIIRSYYATQHARLAAIARRQDMPADKRLREVLWTRMHDSYGMLQADPKILEIAAVIGQERPMLTAEERAHERVFLSELLREGVAAGLFDVRDPESAAEMIQIATLKFAYAQMFAKTPLPQLEREFEGVMDLILHGIMARKPVEATSLA